MGPFTVVTCSCVRKQIFAFAVSIFTLVLVIPRPCAAQTGPLAAPGILPFSTNEWGIDLATGAVDIDVPLRSKTGKIPYSSHFKMTNYYGLNYPSNTWYVSKDFNFQDTTSVGLARKNGTRMPCKHGTIQNGWEWLVTATAVVDQTGASHPFLPRSNPTYWRNDGGAYCPSQSSALAVTNDGGYTLSVPVTGDPVVYDRSGTGSTINAANAPSMTDPDGSTISWTGSLYHLISATDTFNTLVLNIDSYGGYGGLTPASFSYTDASGNKQSYTAGFTTLSLLSAFACGNPEFASSYPMVTSLSTPAGGSYTFDYEPTPGHSGYYTGRIAKITLPSGGSIAYSYSDSNGHNGMDCVYLNVPEITVTVNDNNGNSGIYAYVTSSPSTVGGNRQFTVTKTDPANNQTVYTFYGEYQTQIQTYQGQASGTPLKTVLTCYNGNFTNCAAPSTLPLLPITQTDVFTSLGTSPLSLVETKLDIYGNQTELKQYDFGATIPPSGNPVSDTLISYGQSWNGTSCNAFPSGTYIQDTPCYTHTKNSSGQDVAETQITYSNTGHPTSTSRWTGATWTTSTATYNSNGTLATAADANGNTTSYSYNGAGGCNGILTTSITFPTVNGVTASTLKSWDCNGAVTTSSTDANLKQTTYAYNDPLYRQTQVHFPDGGGTTTTYNTSLTLPWNISTSTVITSSLNLTATSIYDGLGRITQTQLNSDPDGSTFTATAYDALGRIRQQYNPTRCNPPTTQCTQGPPPSSIPETTWGYSTTAYDALGRVTSVTPLDGNGSTSLYTANCVTSSDPASKTRKTCSDALGRLTDVWEDPVGFNYHTAYTYDALGNLLTVVQNGSRNRSFVYDSLSRLTSATNPESGTLSYTYDANGNLSSKTSLAPNQTGTATVTMSYCYDALNRITSKAYSSQSCPMATPVTTYLYDQASYNGLTITNGIGRRTGMTDQAGAEAWSYDSMGRVLFEKRTTNSVSKTIPYTYNLDGSLYSVATPTFTDGSHPWTFNYTPGGAGRPLAMDNIIVNAKYTPAGQLCNSLGQYNGNWTSVRSFNNRLQPTFLYTIRQTAGSPPAPPPCAVSTVLTNSPYQNNALALTYSYIDANNHNNGNVQSITNNLASWRSQSFSYDTLNRLTSAQSAGTHATNPTDCWAESYSYDAWGNLLSDQPNPTTQSAYAGCTAEAAFSTTASANNRIALLTYDAAGNVTTCQSYMAGAATCTYDAENHLTQFAWAGGSNTYTYDGDGKRVMRSGSPGTIYWYGGGSVALIETDLSNNAQAGYAYFNGQRALRILPNNEVGFYFSDHLGNARYFQSLAGDIVTDFYPFGGERVYSTGTTTHYQFTGKERDSESGLDNFGARFDGSSLGRFMSPDPENAGALNSDPQSWNAYTYALNNPINNVDPNGLGTQVCILNGGDSRALAGLSCVWYSDTADFEKAVANSKGVSAQDGKIYATVDGKQVQVGTYLSDEGAPNISSDFLNLYAVGQAAKGIFSLGRLAVSGISNLFKSGAEEAVELAVMVKPNPAEAAMMQELREAGHVVEQLPRSAGKSADFLVDGVETELKTLNPNPGPNTLKNAIETAAKQGEKILVDARNTDLSAEQVANQIARAHGNVGGLEGRVTVLTKEGVVRF